MTLSLFLAKLIGLYLLITAVLCMFRKHQIKTMSKEFVASKSLLALSGEICLIFGLVVVIDHPIFAPNWRGVVTLFGYLMLAKGIMRFAFPSQVRHLASKMMDKGFWVIIPIMLVVGAYLTYSGFTH